MTNDLLHRPPPAGDSAEMQTATSTCWPRTVWEVAPRLRTSEAVPNFDETKLKAAREAFDTTELFGPPAPGEEPRKLSHDKLVELVNDHAGPATLNRGQLIYIEQNKRKPGIHVFKALADVLGLDPFDLMTVTKEEATLADLRAAAGVSKTDLSNKLGYSSNSTWYRIEKGERPLTEDVLREVARLLGVTKTAARAAHERGVQLHQASSST